MPILRHFKGPAAKARSTGSSAFSPAWVWCSSFMKSSKSPWTSVCSRQSGRFQWRRIRCGGYPPFPLRSPSLRRPPPRWPPPAADAAPHNKHVTGTDDWISLDHVASPPFVWSGASTLSIIIGRGYRSSIAPLGQSMTQARAVPAFLRIPDLRHLLGRRGAKDIHTADLRTGTAAHAFFRVNDGRHTLPPFNDFDRT